MTSLAVDAIVAVRGGQLVRAVKAVDGVCLQAMLPGTGGQGGGGALEVFVGTSPVLRLALLPQPGSSAASGWIRVHFVVVEDKTELALAAFIAMDDLASVQRMDSIQGTTALYVLVAEASEVSQLERTDSDTSAHAAKFIPDRIRDNTATRPQPVEDIQGDQRWINMHFTQKQLLSSSVPPPAVVFVGDSIVNQMAFATFYRSLDLMGIPMINLGIGGDQVQHAHWRVQDVMLDAYAGASAKAVVLLVGTNNHNHTARQVAEGILSMGRELARLCPHAQIFIFEHLPRGRSFNMQRIKRKQINRILRRHLHTVPRAELIETGTLIITKDDDEISGELLTDYLHFSDRGYGQLARILVPKLLSAGILE